MGQGEWHVKRIRFMDREGVPVLMQNANGPCPLLAIANILSLRNQLHIPASSGDTIPLDKLLNMIAQRVLDSSDAQQAQAQGDRGYVLNLRQNIEDCLPVLGKLNVGLDVNLRFNSPVAFEPTRELTVFDLLGIDLVHGWVIDSGDQETCSVIGARSFNELQVLLAEAQDAAAAEARLAGTVDTSVVALTAASDAVLDVPDASSPAVLQANVIVSKPADVETSGIVVASAVNALDAAATSSAAQSASEPTVAVAPKGADVGDLLGAEGLLGDQTMATGGTTEPTVAVPHTTVASQLPVKAMDTDAQAGIAAEPPAAVNNDIDLLWAETPAAAATAVACQAADQELVLPVAAGSAELATVAASEPPMLVALEPVQQQQRDEEHQQPQQEQQPEQQQQQQEQQRWKAARLLEEARVVRAFLDRNCSQLTWTGLQDMSKHLRPNQLAVFFRNDHFNVVFKHDEQLYLLVTDEGYRTWPNVVWEHLDRVDGDTKLCGANFQPYVASESAMVAPTAVYEELSEADAAAIAAAAIEGLPDMEPLNTDQQALMVAAQPHAEPAAGAVGAVAGVVPGSPAPAQADEDADLALAMQLQEEEYAAQARAEQQRLQQQQLQQQQQQQVQGAPQMRQQQQQQQQQAFSPQQRAVAQQQPVQLRSAQPMQVQAERARQSQQQQMQQYRQEQEQQRRQQQQYQQAMAAQQQQQLLHRQQPVVQQQQYRQQPAQQPRPPAQRPVPPAEEDRCTIC